jgi:transcriptional regulator with XRE-family HTH domain
MDDGDFGRRLQAARKNGGFRTQEALGDKIGVSGRMIRHYESGKTPPPDVLVRLRAELGEFDAKGDPVEAAIRASTLAPFRQTRVIAAYQEAVYEQQREARGA